jgi:hypothetical protein
MNTCAKCHNDLSSHAKGCPESPVQMKRDIEEYQRMLQVAQERLNEIAEERDKAIAMAKQTDDFVERYSQLIDSDIEVWKGLSEKLRGQLPAWLVTTVWREYARAMERGVEFDEWTAGV